MASNVSMTADEILDEYQMNKLHDLMPVIVIMTIVGVLGIAGNSFTIAFYGFVVRKTPTIYLITMLAVADLIVCTMTIPQIAEMVLNVKFTSAAACKLVHFVAHCAISTSCLTLWFIAIDRYRHVCCPLKMQVSFKGAKISFFVIVVISLLMSIREFFNFDVIHFSIGRQADNESVALAHFCTTTEDEQYRVSVTLFHSIDAASIVTIIVTFCVTYGKIVWTLKKGGFALGNDGQQRDNEESIENNEMKTNVGSKTSEPPTNKGSSTENAKSNSGKENVSGSKEKPNSSKMRKPDKSITLMMCVVSFVFFICFVPYFIVKIGIRSYKSVSQLELGVGIQLLTRIVFVNSFANPIVFCAFNPQFRRYIKKTLLRLKPGPAQLSTTMSTGVP